MRVFVSGHLSVTQEEFDLHYAPILAQHVADSCTFVVGEARGADKLAQIYLKNAGAQVTVFHMHKKPRFNAGFPMNGGYKTDDERDAAMTAASDHDVTWVSHGRENSGTERNLERRQRLKAASKSHGD